MLDFSLINEIRRIAEGVLPQGAYAGAAFMLVGLSRLPFRRAESPAKRSLEGLKLGRSAHSGGRTP